MPFNSKFTSSPLGSKNTQFNPVIISTETSVFGMDKNNPSNYLIPGNGNPAISTSEYFQTFGVYSFRPYDLLQWGSVGTTAMNNNGGKRYVWCMSADHPSIGAYSWTGSEGFYTGFSNQPSEFPSVLEPIPRLSNYGSYFNTGNPSPSGYTVSGGFSTYEFPYLLYNPDDPDGLPIYLFAEAGPDHWSALWRSNDFINFTIKDISHYHTAPGWSSFVLYGERTGVNQFRTIASSSTNPNIPTFSVWTTTNGINYTSPQTPIYGMQNNPDSSGSSFSLGGTFTVGGQLYGFGKEQTTPPSTTNQHVSIWGMDPVTFDKIDSIPVRRLQTSVGGNNSYPGPNYFQDAVGFCEDGILYITPQYGFSSDIRTTANDAGRGGAPYSGGGGLDFEFCDRIIVRVDDSAAKSAAPVQVTASCSGGTVTLNWKNALPQNTYRVYRGTNAASQPTLVGDVAGTTRTDSPSTGRYWYKVVTLDNGIERGSRVVSVYCGSSNAFVNQHINRVLDDGGDISTINTAFLDRADSMLTTTGLKSTLELMTHPACGVKTSTSPIKIYDLGTTRLPRSRDFKALSGSTTYSDTSVNTGPGWTNANGSSWGYWGHIRRGNTIQKKRQITIIAAYERTTTSSDFTFVGTGPLWGNTNDFAKVISLKHTSGSPGNIEFSLCDEAGAKVASTTASGSGMQIAIGTYDGTNMLAYTGNVAGSPNSSLDPNPDFGRTSGTPGYILGSLAGSRNYNASGTQNGVINVGGVGFCKILPFLGSGSVHNYYLQAVNPAQDSLVLNETQAQGKIQCIMVFEKALTQTEINTVVSFLQSTVDW